MVISRLLLKAKYTIQHYIGAIIVTLGVLTVLIPGFLGENENGGGSTVMLIVWCSVFILSCAPMTLSTVYKEKALGELELDVIYLNGWVAVWQFFFNILMAIPSAYASQIPVSDLPDNVLNGIKCYVGDNSILHDYKVGSEVIGRDHCAMAPLFVNLYIAFNVLYNILIILILKYGSSNLLWLAMTTMVPIANFTFALPFVPQHSPVKWPSVLGLVIIMTGLIVYRFWSFIWGKIRRRPTV